MCIALPCVVLAVIDTPRMLVSVSAEDGRPQEIVSAALVATPGQPIQQLVGCFVLIHAGFVISVIDEADARSRQQVFAALRDGRSAIDLGDFYASSVDAPAT